MVLIKKLFLFLFKGDLPCKALQISKKQVREEDYKLSKDEVPNSESANREAGETQQRQVTETIKRDMLKINRNDTYDSKCG
jgi:preprotein translocase subunit SecA